jgi:hypothetical protein
MFQKWLANILTLLKILFGAKAQRKEQCLLRENEVGEVLKFLELEIF